MDNRNSQNDAIHDDSRLYNIDLDNALTEIVRGMEVAGKPSASGGDNASEVSDSTPEKRVIF